MVVYFYCLTLQDWFFLLCMKNHHSFPPLWVCCTFQWAASPCSMSGLIWTHQYTYSHPLRLSKLSKPHLHQFGDFTTMREKKFCLSLSFSLSLISQAYENNRENYSREMEGERGNSGERKRETGGTRQTICAWSKSLDFSVVGMGQPALRQELGGSTTWSSRSRPGTRQEWPRRPSKNSDKKWGFLSTWANHFHWWIYLSS